MGRIKQLRATVQRRTDVIYDELFTRRVSIYFTAALAPLGVTPNQVSYVAFGVGLAACALIAFGTSTQILIGVGLIHLYAVLDSVDGELARLRKQFSLKGLFIEDLSGYVMINAFALAAAWYLHRTGREPIPMIAAITLIAFGRNTMPTVRRCLIKSMTTGRPPESSLVAGNAGSANGLASKLPPFARKLFHFFEENVLHITNMWVVVSAFIAWEAFSNSQLAVTEWVYLFFTALWILKELAVLALMLRKGALDRQLQHLYEAAQPRTTGDASAPSGQSLASFKQSVL